MHFSSSVTINKSVETITRLFANPDNLQYWQDGFVSYKHLSGEPGTVGAKALFTYDIKGRSLELVETILQNDLPRIFSAEYHCEPTTNIMTVTFTSIDTEVTVYHTDVTYTKLNGFMLKIMSKLFPGMFKRQVTKWMNQFKQFCEEQN